jgi:uncharacterized protein YwqG
VSRTGTIAPPSPGRGPASPPHAAVVALLRAAGVPAPLDAMAVERARPAALLIPGSIGAGIEATASRLGGQPAVPPGFVWPRHRDAPLAFLAQLRLDEVPAAVRLDLGLPATGLMAFFYEAKDQPWGFDPVDRGAAVVLCFAELAELARRPPPAELNRALVFTERALALREELSLPAPGTPVYQDFLGGAAEDDQEAYILAFEGQTEPDRATALRHQLGGFAAPIQGPMEVECALVSAGVSSDGIDELDEATLERLEAEAPRWRLLLQLESDDGLGPWGSLGRLYFWVRDDDLRAGALDRVWAVLQCS